MNMDLLRRFWDELSVWSQQTFGPDDYRGPLGPLQHLAKEVQETLQAPGDIVEYADMMHLVLDSARRAGFSYEELISACFSKLEINKSRTWGPWNPSVPTEHKR